VAISSKVGGKRREGRDPELMQAKASSRGVRVRQDHQGVAEGVRERADHVWFVW